MPPLEPRGARYTCGGGIVRTEPAQRKPDTCVAANPPACMMEEMPVQVVLAGLSFLRAVRSGVNDRH